MTTHSLDSSRFIIREKLGEGGMGQVFRAYDRLSGQEVALKQILPDAWLYSTQDPHTLRIDFAREFRTLASLRHPHIVEVITYGFDHNQLPFYVMKLLPDAQDIVLASRRLNVRQKLGLVVQMLRALLYLHNRDILHRDIKPGNVLVENGNVHVLDFGLASTAKRTSSVIQDAALQDDTEVQGTLEYVAPELFMGKPSSLASDLYGVGIILHQIVTGRHPFPFTNVADFMHSVMTQTIDLELVRRNWRALRDNGGGNPLPQDTLVTTKATTKAIFRQENERPDEATGPSDTVLLNRDRAIFNPATPKLNPKYLPYSSPRQVDDQNGTAAPPTNINHLAARSDKRAVNINETLKLNPKYPPYVFSTQVDGQTDTSAPPIPVDLTAEPTDEVMVSIIARLLAKDPRQRYHDAAEVIRDISHAIGQQYPIETTSTRESFLQAAEFVGREMEVQRLRKALDEVLHHQGQVWVVNGERGIGKSRLVEEIQINALVEGALVLKGTAADNATYMLWREPLRSLVLEVPVDLNEQNILKTIIPDIDLLLGRTNPEATPLDPEALQPVLFNTITSLFTRHQRPMMLILEDLHLVSSENVRLLMHMSSTVSTLPLLIIATFSTGENPNLEQQLQGLKCHYLTLERFSLESISRLSESVLGSAGRRSHVVEYLYQQTEGNALFMIEIIRVLAEEAGNLQGISDLRVLPEQVLPKSIFDLLQRRLARVPISALEPLVFAALSGRHIDERVLEKAFPALNLAEWLNVITNVNVLAFHDGHWEFTHHKLQECILKPYSSALLKPFHQRCAELLEQTYPNNPHYASRIADHWRRAENPEQEREYRHVAANHTYQISAFTESSEHCVRLLELIPTDAHLERIKVQNQRASAELAADQIVGASALAEQNLSALSQFTDGSADELLADTHRLVGQISMLRGEFEPAFEHLHAAMAIYKRLDMSAALADTMVTEGRMLARMGRFEEGIKQAKQALNMLVRGQHDWVIASTINLLSGLHGQLGQFNEAKRYALLALAMMQKLGNREAMAGIQSNLGLIALLQNKPDVALQRLQKALPIYRAIRQYRGLTTCMNNLGMIFARRNMIEEARSHFQEALSYAVHLEDPYLSSHNRVNLARMSLLMGYHDHANHLFKEVIVVSRTIGAQSLLLEALIGIGRLQLELHDVAAARQIEAVIRQSPNRSGEVEELLDELATLLEQAEPAAAADLSSTSIEALVNQIVSEQDGGDVAVT